MSQTAEQAQPSPLDIACYELQQAKSAEGDAKRRRIAAEEKVIELVGKKEEGSKSQKTIFYKAATIGKLDRKVDNDALPAVKSEIPEEIFNSVFRYKPEVSVSGLRKVKEDHPDLFPIITRAITTKPAKTAVKVEIL